MIPIVLGLAAVALGTYGLVQWSGDFLAVLKGLLPVTLLCGGVVSVLAGVFSLRK